MDIHSVPKVAHDRPEVPFARDLNRRVERHREDSHGQVGESEGHQEEIVDVTETTEEEDTDDDEEVGEDGEENDEDENCGLQKSEYSLF